jgi:phenylacetate-CoA ligase
VIGRKNQMIKYKGTTLFPNSIYEVLNAQTELESYLVEVSTNEIGTDDITIKLSLKSESSIDFEKKLKDHFRASLRVAPSIEIMEKEALRKIQFPESVRKPITFLDRRV